MHNGFVRVDEEKMSKSLGNFFTVREILKKFDPEVVRFFILRAHYRSSLNYSDMHLEDAEKALTRLYTALKSVDVVDAPLDWEEPHAKQFKEAMDDDFGTPEAVAVLFEIANLVNSGEKRLASQLKGLGAVLGILQRSPPEFLQKRYALQLEPALIRVEMGTLTPEVTLQGFTKSIEQLIRERDAARKAKNFAEADRIRKQLLDAGIELEDFPDRPTTWRSK
jgi:cysteinyl-tRNA synthetase